MGLTLPERFDALRSAFLGELAAAPDLLDPEEAGPLLAEFRDFLAASELAPADLSLEVLEFYLYACARDGENTPELERRLLTLKGFFAWAARHRGVPDMGAGLEPLTRQGRALAMLIYHRWPPPVQAPAVFVPLDADLPEPD